MNNIYIVFSNYYNGCDSWERIEAIFESEERAFCEMEELNKNNTDPSLDYFYTSYVVTEEPNAN